MSSLLRKLLLHAMKFLGICLLNYILMSCYIEIGHDKGWPKAPTCTRTSTNSSSLSARF